MEKLVLTVKETADVLGVSVMTIYKMMSQPDHPIPSMKLGNNRESKAGAGRRLISVDALKQWIAEETEMTMKGRE